MVGDDGRARNDLEAKFSWSRDQGYLDWWPRAAMVINKKARMRCKVVEMVRLSKRGDEWFSWCTRADPFKDLKWANVPEVKLSSLSESDDTFSSLQALSNLHYLFGGFMDYLWSCELNISNFGPTDRKILPVEFSGCISGEESIMSTREYIRKVIKDVGEDDDFTRASWLSVVDYVNVDGGIMTGCFGDVKKFLKNGKLEKVIAVIKSCTPNALGDLTVTLKDIISDTIPYKVLIEERFAKAITVGAALILHNVSVFSPKQSTHHYLNITKKNMVKERQLFIEELEGSRENMVAYNTREKLKELQQDDLVKVMEMRMLLFLILCEWEMVR
ncbi:transposase, MuDR, MULE transposase domain protein [Tanacetum coccineum]